MNRFSAWNMGAVRSIRDGVGHYRLFVGKMPLACAPDALMFNELSVLDADDPPLTHDPRATWDRFVAQHDAWMRRRDGSRIHGWGQVGNGRWAVDLSKPLPWADAIRECETKVRAKGASGLHLDAIMHRPFWARCDGCHDPDAYSRNAHALAEATSSPSMGGGPNEYYSPLSMISHFDYVKLEGFRFHPTCFTPGDGWSGEGAPKTWHTWWEGRPDPRQYGIVELEAQGIVPVIQALYDPAWDDEKIRRYTTIAVATACLAERALVAVHEQRGGVCDPIWTGAHDLAWSLRDPLGPAEKTPSGTWRRRFSNGVVSVNPQGFAVGPIEPHSARIDVG